MPSPVSSIQLVNAALCRFIGWGYAMLLGNSLSIEDSFNSDQTFLVDMQLTFLTGSPRFYPLLNCRRWRSHMHVSGQILTKVS
jgi:hypothetical protein